MALVDTVKYFRLKKMMENSWTLERTHPPQSNCKCNYVLHCTCSSNPFSYIERCSAIKGSFKCKNVEDLISTLLRTARELSCCRKWSLKRRISDSAIPAEFEETSAWKRNLFFATGISLHLPRVSVLIPWTHSMLSWNSTLYVFMNI
jgi:hypothetical protein